MKNERFVDLMDRWLSEQMIMEISKKNPRTALRGFLGYCGEREPTRVLLVGWITGWSGSSLTMQNYAGSMRRFFRWLGYQGFYEDIGYGLKNYTRKQWEHSRMPLTEKQVNLLLEHLAGYNQPCGRDIAAILLMLNCGLRCCEVIRARVGDIYRQGEETCLRVQGKGHVYPDAWVILTPYLLSKINLYLDGRPGPKGEDGLIFMTLTDPPMPMGSKRLSAMCRYHLEAIGLFWPRYTAYSLRHTAATLALERGAAEEQVSKMLRHVDPRTTRIYTRYVDRMRNPAERVLDFRAPEAEETKVIPLRRV